jgi:hypothetical protein
VAKTTKRTSDRRTAATRIAAAPAAPLSTAPVAGQILDARQGSLLDVVDHLLNKGVMATGDVTLGVAGVDLVYVRLSALLCAADRVLPRDAPSPVLPTRQRARRRRS